MASDVTREEFRNLEARVDVVEREVDGEKLVSRHILKETRQNSDDLAAIKSRLDRHDTRFDNLERKVDTLTKDLPRIVGEVMREVLRERDGKK
jgi:hypothetical protein